MEVRSGWCRGRSRSGQWMGVLGGWLAPLSLVMAHVAPDNQELLRQQERERALREQQEQAPDVRLKRTPAPVSERLPTSELPCFPIDSIVLDGEDARRFGWAAKAADLEDDPALGTCLGTGGINVVIKRVQNAIIAKGYVTTRVSAAEQDVKSTRKLTLTVVPGRIRVIRFAEGTHPRTTLWNTVPLHAGDLLNIRDVEQALENLQRSPTLSADVQIVPAAGNEAKPGESDLVVTFQQRAVLRTNVTLDDSGSEATGKLQAGATVSIDDALGWGELFYANYGHDVFNARGKGTESWTLHGDVPVGYWLLGATASAYDYHQAVAGPYQTYVYSGSSHNADVRAARLLFRNATTKLGVYGRGWWKESDNFIDDTEIEVQRRRTAGWEVGVTHKQFLGPATLDGSVAYRRGTGAFDALSSPEEVAHAFDPSILLEGTSRMKVITADAQLAVPFKVGNQALRYNANWRAQWNDTPLSPQDRFAIGGRFTVRGFDGEVSLTGERGWLIRNDFSLALGGGQELYLGADYGHVGGPSTQWQLGAHLAGAVIGLRGGWHGLAWDWFIGAPISMPDYFPTAYTTTGFSLSASF